MKKVIVLLVASVALVLSGMAVSADNTSSEPSNASLDDHGCKGKQSVGLVKSACKRGGQKAAKSAMKGWVKKVKKLKKAKGDTSFKLTCKTCHTSLKGAYPLKGSGLSKFKSLNKWYKANK